MNSDKHVNNQQAGSVGAGSEDLGEASSPSKVNRTTERGADVDNGALSAWGGIRSRAKTNHVTNTGRPSIQRPGYPMAGENSSPDSHGEHGAVEDSDRKPMGYSYD